jgi:hypothetical protein
LALALFTLALVAPAAHAGRGSASRTKMQAEVDVLRALPHRWKPTRLRGLIDRRTHLLKNGTQASCHGRGRPSAGRRYSSFLCVVQLNRDVPRRKGLFVTYRARPRGRFTISWIGYRRR